MDQQKRFILAMVLSVIVLFGWQFFFPPQEVPPAEGDQVTKAKEGTKEQQKSTANTNANPTKGTPSVEAVEPSPNSVPVASHSLTGEKFKVSFTNQGAALAGITILKPEQYQKAGDLLAEFGKDSKDLPFQIGFEKGSVKLPKELVWEVAESTAKKVVYRWAGPNYALTKSYSLNEKHPYALDFEIGITNQASTSLVDRLLLNVTGAKDPKKEKSFLDFRPDEAEAICRLEDDTERELFSALKEQKVFKEKPVKWGGINTRYFMWSSVFDKPAESCTMSKKDNLITTQIAFKEFSIAAGTTYTSKQLIYVGPKDVDVLTTIGSDLEESVDYGILTILAKPLRFILNWFQKFVLNWGLAIILLTLLIKLLTWPLTEKSYANAERMKLIQPKLEAVRKKYENDQQRLAEETMKLFKEEGHNPLGGCLPMVVQMPILYGLYVMIINSVELYQAPFMLWYTDLSARDPYFVLPILMGLVMVVQQQFMTATAPNPQTKIMMRVMPIMFTAFMLFLPSGLVLYYFLNLLLGVLQQWLIRRKFERQAAAKATA